MKDNRSEKVKALCDQFIHNGCRDKCPLREPCQLQSGDTKEIFDERVNKAAEKLEEAA